MKNSSSDEVLEHALVDSQIILSCFRSFEMLHRVSRWLYLKGMPTLVLDNVYYA
jgi:hypothetical protein